ncbi:hypothetical protein [Streptomyces sp. CB02613]|uniref:hypothetical protein n=2 Tax=Streptomyces TaxID=1883 RepID=UPI001F271034|nr:hypothetical protein [Streptomyces sp. CB02613]
MRLDRPEHHGPTGARLGGATVRDGVEQGVREHLGSWLDRHPERAGGRHRARHPGHGPGRTLTGRRAPAADAVPRAPGTASATGDGRLRPRCRRPGGPRGCRPCPARSSP